jgi:hypothetical protein
MAPGSAACAALLLRAVAAPAAELPVLTVQAVALDSA